MSEVPDALKGAIQVELLPEFYRRVEFQAAILDLDGPLPWPEELDRPGWRVLFAPEGHRDWRFPVPADVTVQMQGQQADPRVPDERTVEPELQQEVGVSRGRYWVGLGWSVQDRTLVVFHELIQPHF